MSKSMTDILGAEKSSAPKTTTKEVVVEKINVKQGSGGAKR